MSQSKVEVVRVSLGGLRRGDQILAIRWKDCGQREAGVSQKSRVLGTFVMRHKIDSLHTAVVHRDRTGAVRGHDSRHLSNSVAFVLRPKAVPPTTNTPLEQETES